MKSEATITLYESCPDNAILLINKDQTAWIVESGFGLPSNFRGYCIGIGAIGRVKKNISTWKKIFPKVYSSRQDAANAAFDMGFGGYYTRNYSNKWKYTKFITEPERNWEAVYNSIRR